MKKMDPDLLADLLGSTTIVVTDQVPNSVIETNFRQFHLENPDVYKELVRLAREALKMGHRKIGIGLLWEVMRWNLTIKIIDKRSDFLLNNNYRSRYARLIMEQEEDLRNIFEIRELKS